MSEQSIGAQATHVQEEALKISAPLQGAWRNTFFDLPLTMFSETMRFVGQRLQAHGDFLASLRSCQTVPEVIDAQSTFVRTAVDQYGAESSKIMEDMRATVSKAA